MIESIQTDTLETVFDEATGIAYGTYKGELTPDLPAQAYAWFIRIVQAGVPLESVKGVIFDFRAVTTFHPTNASTTQTKSRQIKKQMDISHIPVGLVVGTRYQESMVRVSQGANRVQDRTRIVWSMEEAVKFIQDFHKADATAKSGESEK